MAVSSSQDVLNKLLAVLNEAGDAVDVGNFPDTQMVSGTFWQATQPVSEKPASGLTSGVITLNGSAQRITTNSTPCKYVYLHNHTGNAVIYWGGSTVTTNHPAILADDGRAIEIDDVSKLYFVGTNGQYVGYAYSTQ